MRGRGSNQPNQSSVEPTKLVDGRTNQGRNGLSVRSQWLVWQRSQWPPVDQSADLLGVRGGPKTNIFDAFVFYFVVLFLFVLLLLAAGFMLASPSNVIVLPINVLTKITLCSRS